MTDFPAESQPVTPTASETQPFYWTVRRELWENRFVYIAPLMVAGFVLFASFISVVMMAKKGGAVHKPFSMAPAPIMLATFLIGFFYCLDALYGERRDRSILFWKSLPISDRMIVLAKVAIPMAVLPAIAWALSVITQVLMLFMSAPFLAAFRVDLGAFFDEFRFFEGLLVMIYGLVVHTLWFAPIYGYLLLTSAWARRAPFLWAVLPPLAIGALERILFNSTLFIHVIGYRFAGAMREAFSIKSHSEDIRVWELSPGRFLTAPGLWVGLAFAAICIAAAVRLRRFREPIGI